MRKFIRGVRIVGLFGLSLLGLLLAGNRPASAQAATQTLWYNGDLFGQNTLINHIGGSVNARVFDNFIVTAPGGWQLTSVFSNNAFIASFFGGPPNVTQADWSIRTGLSEGNAGTIVASGVGAATRTLTGRAPNFLYQEYTIEVSGLLSVFLAPGTYWLNVTPLFGGDAFVTSTRGDNAIGLPKGNDGNAFLDWPGGGFNVAGQGQRDYSMGVRGVAIPEPGTGALLLLSSAGLLMPLAARRVVRRQRRTAA